MPATGLPCWFFERWFEEPVQYKRTPPQSTPKRTWETSRQTTPCRPCQCLLSQPIRISGADSLALFESPFVQGPISRIAVLTIYVAKHQAGTASRYIQRQLTVQRKLARSHSARGEWFPGLALLTPNRKGNRVSIP